jgi:hypothetical protein
VEIGCIRGFPRKDYIAGGLVLRESGTGKLVILEHGYGNGGLGIASVSWNSNTSFNTAIFKNDQPAGHAFFRASRSGSNIQLSMSYDGATWFNMGPAFALTTYFTAAPDQWGIALNANNADTPNIDARIDAFHWSEA